MQHDAALCQINQIISFGASSRSLVLHCAAVCNYSIVYSLEAIYIEPLTTRMPTDRPRLHISLLPGYRRALIKEAVRINMRDPSPTGLAAQIVEEWIQQKQRLGELPPITDEDVLLDHSVSIKQQIQDLIKRG